MTFSTLSLNGCFQSGGRSYRRIKRTKSKFASDDVLFLAFLLSL